MIDYELYCKLKDYHENRRLSVAQIACELGLDERTVSRWLNAGKFRQRGSVPAPQQARSLQDADHPLAGGRTRTPPCRSSCACARAGYRGRGPRIVKDYVQHVRPRRTQAFLTLDLRARRMRPGGLGPVRLDPGRPHAPAPEFLRHGARYSRMLYVEFTVSETLEHFLACHQNAFAFFHGVPSRIMVDNLKSAVLKRSLGEAPVFNPRYKDFADHYGFQIVPCGVGQAHEKGRVENAVGYVKRTFSPAWTSPISGWPRPPSGSGWTAWPTCACTAA